MTSEQSFCVTAQKRAPSVPWHKPLRAAFEPPRHPGRRRAKWLVVVGASIIVALVIAL